ncbi:MAG: hypothetical protein KDD50_03845 [Bdellovibrionales bacterium]|nr:hypothetical protein [Bdellovibrionales bacterium]
MDLKIFIALILSFLVVVISPSPTLAEAVLTSPYPQVDTIESSLTHSRQENVKNFGPVGALAATGNTLLAAYGWHNVIGEINEPFLAAVITSAAVNYLFTYKPYYLKIMRNAPEIANKILNSTPFEKFKKTGVFDYTTRLLAASSLSILLSSVFNSIENYQHFQNVFSSESFVAEIASITLTSLALTKGWDVVLAKWMDSSKSVLNHQIKSKIYLATGFAMAYLHPYIINNTSDFTLISFSSLLTSGMVYYFGFSIPSNRISIQKIVSVVKELKAKHLSRQCIKSFGNI